MYHLDAECAEIKKYPEGEEGETQVPIKNYILNSKNRITTVFLIKFIVLKHSYRSNRRKWKIVKNFNAMVMLKNLLLFSLN